MAEADGVAELVAEDAGERRVTREGEGGVVGATHVAKWLESQVLRPDLGGLAFDVALDGLVKAWKENPEKRLPLARQLEASTLPGRREAAFLLTMTGLREAGKYKEALAMVEKELARAPRDRRFLEFKSDLLPQVGLFERTLGIDLFTCPCGGRRSIVAFITSEEEARKVLGLSPRDTSTVPQRRATGPPQLALALP